MADVIYNSFKATIMDGSIDLDTDTIKVALVTISYTPDLSNLLRSELFYHLFGAILLILLYGHSYPMNMECDAVLYVARACLESVYLVYPKVKLAIPRLE